MKLLTKFVVILGFYSFIAGNFLDQFSWLVDLPAMTESLKSFYGQ